ncbi:MULTISPECIES: glycosyltransferase family 4 protein [Methanobacterium]|uniref:Glycosyl transferase family 1 n=1 Tax=Methanobacterium bryantii TaxID=2161 RepID=A0A2A2HA70_METBR|nr:MULTISPECIES: glycosyltransferase family 4 protein [Methanobacterium]OEC88464.1 glycosyl transferase family 1 [Methanobacterium sp. A39]PAV06381.1 glycosyl transferase family 1 [Methanobacterium bryantii]
MEINNNLKDIKILFIHNTVMWYRKPFFKKLSEIYNIKFIFTHMQASKEIYNVEIPDEIEGMNDVNYTVLKNHFNIAFGAIKESFGDYDILVGGSWDTLSELFETTFYFMVAKLRRKKFVIWREDWAWGVESFKKSMITPLIKLIIRNSDAVIVPGTKHMEYFISLGSSPSKTFLMPNVSNMECKSDYLEKKEFLKEKLKLKNKKVVLYVGRLVKRKGVEYLIKSFKKLHKQRKDIVLVIVGDGNCRSQLESISLGIDDIYFTGQIGNEDLPAYYALCDVCVVPSITYEMGDPWVFILNEAMYFGKPVIATDAVGAAFDMIKNGENGFIVPERDVESLYKTIAGVLSDPDLKEKMGYKSKQIIEERFRYWNMVKGFQNAVNYVINK